MSCWQCGHAIEIAPGDRVGNRSTCSECDADLHVCRNCRHYDPKVNQECRETQAEWVRSKDRNNYCEYFAPVSAAARAATPSRENDARSGFDQLFKK